MAKTGTDVGTWRRQRAWELHQAGWWQKDIAGRSRSLLLRCSGRTVRSTVSPPSSATRMRTRLDVTCTISPATGQV